MVSSPTDVQSTAQSMREEQFSGHRVTSASVMFVLLPVLGSTGVLPDRITGSPVMDCPIVPLGDRSVMGVPTAQLQAGIDFDRDEQPSHSSGVAAADNSASYLTLLETDGTLERGDRIAYQDGSLYDEYAIEGSQGQQIHIHLESPEFDPYLVVIGPSGNIVAQNDDVGPGNYSAFLDLVLPSDGIYRVVANGFDRYSQGDYRLIVLTPSQGSESTEDTQNAPSESLN